ncbi:MAG TPA: carbamoyltransferase HypF, partial [Candidatus Angelobacter sp.]|nr:carbamoyltransferase HypF [Candidatus Angelobacter sp.]
GGDKAVKEPRRVALSILRETYGAALPDEATLPTLQAFSGHELRVLDQMQARGVRSPRTSSAGRLFDAVASIIGLRQVCRFEGQAAMELEFLTHGVHTEGFYPFDLASSDEGVSVDWAPMVRAIVDELRQCVPLAAIATKFHNTLVEMMVRVATECDEEKVTLSGGCFQNRYLTERAVKRLQEAGFRPYSHQRVPPNDGGIALGQVLAVARAQTKTKSKATERQSVCA